MSKKLPEALFRAFAVNGQLKFKNLDDLNRYCVEHEGIDLIVHVSEETKKKEKMRMYAFYYVNVLECAVLGYTAAGYEGVDKVKADYLLRAELAKDFIRKPDGSYQPIMLDKRNFTKTRMLKFLSDAIFFIEQELQVRVPESEEWKINVKTGKNFKKV